MNHIFVLLILAALIAASTEIRAADHEPHIAIRDAVARRFPDHDAPIIRRVQRGDPVIVIDHVGIWRASANPVWRVEYFYFADLARAICPASHRHPT